MMKTNRLLACGIAAIAFTATTAADAKLKRITIGSNAQGSVYFLLASGFAKELQQKLKVRATAQPHAGSSIYMPVVNAGEMTLGLNNSMDSGAAIRGGAPFKTKMTNIRALARVWIIPYGFMVKGDSDIKAISDLKGRKVVTETGPVVSLTNLNIAYLHSGGVSLKDITAIRSGGIVDNINKVVEGRAAAAAVALGMPAVRKAHAGVPGGIRILPLGAGGTDEFLNREVPGSRGITQNPGNTRPFLTEPTRISAFDAYLNAGKAVNAEDAYRIIKVLHTNWKSLQKAYGPLRGVPQDQICPPTNPHPYHDGVVRYLKEAKLWTAAHEKKQKEAYAAMK